LFSLYLLSFVNSENPLNYFPLTHQCSPDLLRSGAPEVEASGLHSEKITFGPPFGDLWRKFDLSASGFRTPFGEKYSLFDGYLLSLPVSGYSTDNPETFFWV
jgi:hypothetical protein